jgi:hypothetical protein
MIRFLALSLLAAVVLHALTACHPLPAPQPPPAPVGDAGPADACLAFCAHATALHCVSASPSPGGLSCEAVCRNALGPAARASGLTVRYLQCCTAASSCTAEATCPR